MMQQKEQLVIFCINNKNILAHFVYDKLGIVEKGL